jgi:hypothetical protein
VSELTSKDWDDEFPTDVDKWLAIYVKDDYLFWASHGGHHMNVIDELILRLEQVDKRTEERIIKAVTNASAQIADLYWYRAAGMPEKAFEFLLSVIKGENK